MARYSKMVAEIMAALDVVFVESAPKQTRVVFLSESGAETAERPEIVDRPRLLSMAGQMVNDHPSRGNRIAFVIADGSGRLEKGWHVRFERASKAAKRSLVESQRLSESLKDLDTVKTEGHSTDRENAVGPFYAQIVFMQDSEADEPLQILKDKGPKAAATYLSQWDAGDSPDISTTPPWGDEDDTYKVTVPNAGTYILSVNTRVGYIGLVKIVSREEYRALTHESRSHIQESSVQPTPTTQRRLRESEEVVGNLAHAKVEYSDSTGALVWQDEATGVTMELGAPGTAGNLRDTWEAGIRYRGWAKDSAHFDTREEATQWLDKYDLASVTSDSGPGRKFVGDFVRGLTQKETTSRARTTEARLSTQPPAQPTSQDWSKSPYLKKQVTVQGEGDTPWSGTYEELMQANTEDMPEELLTLKPGETVKVGGGAAPTFTVSMTEREHSWDADLSMKDFASSPYLRNKVRVTGGDLEDGEEWAGSFEDLLKANEDWIPHEMLDLAPGKTVRYGGGAAPTFIVTMLEGQERSWKALHRGETFYGTQEACRQWARDREDAQVVDPNGYVRFVCRRGRLIRVEKHQRRTESSDSLYALVLADGYLYGASTEPSAKNFGFWGYTLETDDEPWVIVQIAPFGKASAEVFKNLEAQGTEDQVYSDGYEAWDVAFWGVKAVVDYNREVSDVDDMLARFNISPTKLSVSERVDINDIPDYSVQTFTVVSDNRKEIDLVAQSITKNSSLKVKGQPREKDGEFLLPVEAHLQAGSADPTQEGIDMIQDAIAQAGIQQESIQVETVRVVGSATDGTWVFVRSDEGEYSSLVEFAEALVKADSIAFPQIEKTPALKKVALLVSMEAAADPAAAESVIEHALTEGYAGVNPKDFFEEGVVEHRVWIKAQKALREDTQSDGWVKFFKSGSDLPYYIRIIDPTHVSINFTPSNADAPVWHVAQLEDIFGDELAGKIEKWALGRVPASTFAADSSVGEGMERPRFSREHRRVLEGLVVEDTQATGPESEVPAEMDAGLVQWVRDYIKARHYGNVNLARSIKTNIDRRIKEKGLNSAEVYNVFGDPDDPKQKDAVLKAVGIQ